MLYAKQKANPRSPLTVIRNQIKNLQSTSIRSISRSPSYSPVSRNLKNASKDYSTYIPVRSSSKIENTKPSLSSSAHTELKTKRKELLSESKKLEAKVKEIKLKVEREVRSVRVSNKNKFPRSHCSLLGQTLKKVLSCQVKAQLLFGLKGIKEKSLFLKNFEEEKLLKFTQKTKSKTFAKMKEELIPLIEQRKEKEEIAKRHYNLQLLLSSLSRWQEHLNANKLRPEDKSCIEEMDSLLESFVHDSSHLCLSPSSVTPQKLSFYDSGSSFRDPSPKPFKLVIPEKLNFDSSALFSFRNTEVTELETIADSHYQNSLMVSRIQHFKGLLPWKKFVDSRKETSNNKRTARRFVKTKRLEKAFHGFLINFVESDNDPYRSVIQNFRKVIDKQYILLPKALNAWTQLIQKPY